MGTRAVMGIYGARFAEARYTEIFWGRGQRRVPRYSWTCVPTPWRGYQNSSCTLQPKLLPNSVVRAGMETDKERRDNQEVPTNRGVPGCTGTGRNGRNRIRGPPAMK